MNAVEYILNGLVEALELERELGVRSVEIDRALLEDGRVPAPQPVGDSGNRPAAQPVRQSGSRTTEPSAGGTPSDLVFLHDRPLSPAGVEMMAKIITALGRTAENSPIVVVPPVPKKTKVLVVLGGRALKLYFPKMKGEPGQWTRLPTGEDVLITYSPEYILRFGTVTPAVQKLKQDMWRSLKAVAQRLRGQT